MGLNSLFHDADRILFQEWGEEVVYSRGGYNCDWRAVQGKTDFEQTDANGVLITFQSADWIGQASSLVDEMGTRIVPTRGDRIYRYSDETTFIYEVLNLGSTPCYQYSDPDRFTIRVHTKLIEAIAPLPPSPSPSPTPSVSPSRSLSPSLSLSLSPSPSISLSPSPSPSASPSLSLSPSPSLSLSLSPSASASASPEPPSPSPSPSLFPTDVLFRGNYTLSSGTSTTVTDANVKATSIIVVLKSNNVQTQYTSYISSKSDGSFFVVVHNSAAGTETMNYIIVNGTTDKIKTGSGTLTAGTSTTVNDANVNADSKIFIQATNANTFGKFPRVVSKSAGSFQITHASAAGTESYDYVVFNASGEDDIYLGTGTLSVGTSTTVTDANATPTSTILLQSTNAMSAYAYWRVTAKYNGSFVILTNAVAGTETFDYAILNT